MAKLCFCPTASVWSPNLSMCFLFQCNRLMDSWELSCRSSPSFNFVLSWPTQILMHSVWGIIIKGVCHLQPYRHALLKMLNIYLCDYILLLDCVWGNFLLKQKDTAFVEQFLSGAKKHSILQVCYIVNMNGKEGTDDIDFKGFSVISPNGVWVTHQCLFMCIFGFLWVSTVNITLFFH